MIRRRNLLLAASLLVAGWGVLGWLEIGRTPWVGYWSDGDDTIIRILPGSPAEAAGMREGDRIVAKDGIPVSETRAMMERGRPPIGETVVFEIERDGARQKLDIELAPLPPDRRALWRASIVVGYCFVVFGLLAYLRHPDSTTLLFALVGICLGLAFCEGPYIESARLRAIVASVQSLTVIVGFATLLLFTLSFPRRKRLLDRPWALRLIYLPALLVGGFLVFLLLFQPDTTSGLNVFSRALFGLFVAAYFGLSAFSLLHTWVGADREQRARDGLSLLLAGSLLGLVPVTIANLAQAIMPTYLLPGVEYYFLTLALIPISFFLATELHYRRRA